MGHKPRFRDIPFTVSQVGTVCDKMTLLSCLLPALCVSGSFLRCIYPIGSESYYHERWNTSEKKNQIYFKIKNMHNVLFILLFFPIPTIESWVVIFVYLYSNILYSANPQSVLKPPKINKQIKSGPDSPTATPPSTEIPGLPKTEKCLIIIHHSASIVHPVSLQVSEGAPVHVCLPLGNNQDRRIRKNWDQGGFKNVPWGDISISANFSHRTTEKH